MPSPKVRHYTHWFHGIDDAKEKRKAWWKETPPPGAFGQQTAFRRACGNFRKIKCLWQLRMPSSWLGNNCADPCSSARPT